MTILEHFNILRPRYWPWCEACNAPISSFEAKENDDAGKTVFAVMSCPHEPGIRFAVEDCETCTDLRKMEYVRESIRRCIEIVKKRRSIVWVPMRDKVKIHGGGSD